MIEAMNEAGGSLRLHHIGHAVRDVEAATEIYAVRFGYEAVTGTVHDPLQTALVRFLQIPGEASYLELIAPDGSASKLTNAVRRGGGLHHLCYTAGILETEIERLEGAGMKLISELLPAAALGGRRICWLVSDDQMLVELVERRDDGDLCVPGFRQAAVATTSTTEILASPE